MRQDDIDAVGIDDRGSLWVKPATEAFPLIYRAGMEVNWDESRECLWVPKPREWTYSRWFQQISAAVAGEYAVQLHLTARTRWQGIDRALQIEIEQSRH